MDVEVLSMLQAWQQQQSDSLSVIITLLSVIIGVIVAGYVWRGDV